uniref:Uncharacterized protein n=1 Tax=Flabellia petiolata TaxID=189428 RepID=A0A386AX82_9CHLO|nr:hypothetical protein [Flabellia petiolata]
MVSWYRNRYCSINTNWNFFLWFVCWLRFITLNTLPIDISLTPIPGLPLAHARPVGRPVGTQTPLSLPCTVVWASAPSCAASAGRPVGTAFGHRSIKIDRVLKKYQ